MEEMKKNDILLLLKLLYFNIAFGLYEQKQLIVSALLAALAFFAVYL